MPTHRQPLCIRSYCAAVHAHRHTECETSCRGELARTCSHIASHQWTQCGTERCACSTELVQNGG
eukprot:353183-Chlamydomonas_euryale.AAC.8